MVAPSWPASLAFDGRVLSLQEIAIGLSGLCALLPLLILLLLSLCPTPPTPTNSLGFDHPNLVRALHYARIRINPNSGEASLVSVSSGTV